MIGKTNDGTDKDTTGGSIVFQDINVGDSPTARIDFSLDVGSVAERLNVEASAPLVQTEDGSVGQVINKDEVVGLR